MTSYISQKAFGQPWETGVPLGAVFVYVDKSYNVKSEQNRNKLTVKATEKLLRGSASNMLPHCMMVFGGWRTNICWRCRSPENIRDKNTSWSYNTGAGLLDKCPIASLESHLKCARVSCMWSSQGRQNILKTQNTRSRLISGVYKPVKARHELMTMTTWSLSCWEAPRNTCRPNQSVINPRWNVSVANCQHGWK